MTELDWKLEEALYLWQDKEMEQCRYQNKDFFGPCLVMPNCVLSHIVDLACSKKLTCPEVLIEQTKWHDSSKHANEILQIINEICPQEFTQTKPQNNNGAAINPENPGPLQSAMQANFPIPSQPHKRGLFALYSILYIKVNTNTIEGLTRQKALGGVSKRKC
jgi:hypothetical protein